MKERFFKRPRFIVFIFSMVLCTVIDAGRHYTRFTETIFPLERMAELKGRMFSVFSNPKLCFAEMFIIAAAVFAVCAVIYLIVRFIRVRRKGRFFVNYIVFLLALVLVIRLFFLVFCGVDYARTPIKEQMGLDTRPQSAQVLFDTALYIQGELNAAADTVARDQKGAFTPSRSARELTAASQEVFETYADHIYFLHGHYTTPKTVELSELMNYLLISGFYFPYTGEANVNVRDGRLYFPYTACHEKAHQYGVMREDEASFLAFLACMESTDEDFRYSALVKAYQVLSNRLYYTNLNKYYELSKTLDKRVAFDIQLYREHTIKYVGKASDFSESVNDTYLKSQGQENGTASYGELADLLIAWYLKTQVVMAS
ncbi:MAG: DUF3810 domain-containing protein [Clostridia bacterium]|nr:DUF3810 domain-containing protein [Clostridia bacterium]